MATTELQNYADHGDGSTVLEQPSVELKPWVGTAPAPEADCCGAIACRTEEFLVRVSLPSMSRVLCPDHAALLIRREGGIL